MKDKVVRQKKIEHLTTHVFHRANASFHKITKLHARFYTTFKMILLTVMAPVFALMSSAVSPLERASIDGHT